MILVSGCLCKVSGGYVSRLGMLTSPGKTYAESYHRNTSWEIGKKLTIMGDEVF